jgi:hypothetical protein
MEWIGSATPAGISVLSNFRKSVNGEQALVHRANAGCLPARAACSGTLIRTGSFRLLPAVSIVWRGAGRRRNRRRCGNRAYGAGRHLPGEVGRGDEKLAARAWLGLGTERPHFLW